MKLFIAHNSTSLSLCPSYPCYPFFIMRNESCTPTPISPTKFFIFGCSFAVSFTSAYGDKILQPTFSICLSFFFFLPSFLCLSYSLFSFYPRISSIPICFSHSLLYVVFHPDFYDVPDNFVTRDRYYLFCMIKLGSWRNGIFHVRP